jgi:hypothetical protein
MKMFLLARFINTRNNALKAMEEDTFESVIHNRGPDSVSVFGYISKLI